MLTATGLTIYLVFGLIAFGWRGWRQYQQTGDSGFRGLSGRIGSLEWFGGCLLIVGASAGLAAFAIELWGGGSRFTLVLPVAERLGGLGLMVVGVGVTLGAQSQMGSSWRVGLDSSEVTALVTTGPFRWVRNPIFSAMLLVFFGVLLTAPNIIACVAVMALFAGIEIQVRRVEEPYLIRIHGERYLSYARRAGRFVPGLGRIK